jgi:transcriptional regulator with XRE-family HTH domain
MGRRETIGRYFSERLRDERERQGWSQSHMAKLLTDNGIQMHATTIAKIEAGDRFVRIDEATGIADILDVSLDSLLGRNARLEDDPTYPLRALTDKAQRSLSDVGAIERAFRDRVVDVRALQFPGREQLDSAGARALVALKQAQEAFWEIAGFVVPDASEVQVSFDRPTKLVEQSEGADGEAES